MARVFVFWAFLHLAELELPGDREGLQGVGSGRAAFGHPPGKGDAGVKESTFGKDDKRFPEKRCGHPDPARTSGSWGRWAGEQPPGDPRTQPRCPPASAACTCAAVMLGMRISILLFFLKFLGNGQKPVREGKYQGLVTV